VDAHVDDQIKHSETSEVSIPTRVCYCLSTTFSVNVIQDTS